ncbi:MAG: SdpI family protein [Armatimonadota bacterium]|nr:SdpI family protein [bacterium]
MKSFSMLSWFLAGLLFVVLALPLIFGKVPPNRLYGFRVEKTMRDPEIWYAANRYSGWGMFWIGVAVTITSVVLAFIPGLNELLYALICLGVLHIVGITTLILCFKYLETL